MSKQLSVALVEGRSSDLTSFGPHLVALAIGVVAFLILFGPRFLLNESPYLTMPIGDVAAEMGGYFRMAQDSWRFPLFALPTANEPEGANQLFIGGVPLLALFAKVVHSLTGARINLFGFWYFLCVVLQAHSFYFLVSQITDRRPYLAAMAAVIGVLAYAFVTRFGHVSLFGQFVNIYGMAFVVATTRSDAAPNRVMAWLAGLSFLAMFIFAYLAITNVVLFCAGLLSLWWLGRISLRRASINLLVYAAALLILAWAGGYFWGAGRAEPVPMSSYGTLGFNLGSLVIPHQSMLFPSRPFLYDWWGGDFYLGAGIIALWGFFLLFNPKAITGPLLRNWPVVLLLFGFVLFCASNHVSFGATTLFTYPLPRFVAPVIGMARAGGRLFWPIGYLLLAAPLALTILQYPKQASVAVLAVAIVSILEASGSYAFLQSRISVPQPIAVNYEGLKSVIAQHKAVRIYPSFWCDPGADGTFKRFLHWQVEYASALANAASNSVITARKIKDCDREALEMRVLQPGEFNIFLSMTTARQALSGQGADPAEVCRSFRLDAGEALMCASDWTRSTQLPIPELGDDVALVPQQRVGTIINFGKDGNKADLLGDGWWRDSEVEFTWTEGASSSLSLKLPDVPSSNLTLVFNVLGFLQPPQISSRDVRVSINGREIAAWTFLDGGWHEKRIPLPAGLDGQVITITFLQADTRSPKELTGADDPRRLGVAVKSLTLMARP